MAACMGPPSPPLYRPTFSLRQLCWHWYATYLPPQAKLQPIIHKALTYILSNACKCWCSNTPAMLALVCYLPPTPAKVQPMVHKAFTYILTHLLQMLMQHYTSYAGIDILPASHPDQSLAHCPPGLDLHSGSSVTNAVTALGPLWWHCI